MNFKSFTKEMTLVGALVGSLAGAVSCSTGAGVVPTNGNSSGNGSAGNGSTGSNDPGNSGSSSGTGSSTGSVGGLPPAGSTPASGAGGASGQSGSTPTGMNNCGVSKIDLQKRPADLLLVLDRSRSMLEDSNGVTAGQGGGRRNMDAAPPMMGPTKWSQVTDALDPVLMQTQDKVNWGLKLFPLSEQCGVPDPVDVAIGANNYMSVISAVKAADPGNGNGGSTPTRLAMEKAVTILKGLTTPEAKYILLATDGLPNCGAGGGGRGDDAAGAIAAVEAAATAGFPTYVIGIATSGTDANDTLNQMADKGGRPRNDPTTKYFPVASKDELSNALGIITGQIASCVFPLTTPPPVPTNVAVEIDGNRVSQDTAQKSGWNYGANNKSIELFGSTCDDLKSGKSKNVQILYGCPGVQIN